MSTKKRLYQCNVDSDVSEKFTLALMLNKEDADDVVEKLMSQYIADSFAKVSKAFSPNEVKKSSFDESDEDYAKANRKIPGWARKPQQNNHKIIKAFFELEEESGYVTVDEMVERCSNVEEYPETFLTDFRGNFAQMKTDASNSHGKVFIINDNDVKIWVEIKDVLMENKKYFLGNNDGVASRNKITKQQIALVYDYAKKAYLGEISAPKAAKEVSEESGINVNSASRSIYVLKNMMNAEGYKSIIGEEQTRYYFTKILQDFGKEKLALAIASTEKHIDYRETKFHTNVLGIREIVTEVKKSI